MTRTYTTPTGKIWSIYSDMLDQVHLLVAGEAGSGKSVVINGMLSTALYRLPGVSVGRCQFILIDPKRVELVQYRYVPHTIRYASEPEEFLPALSAALQICEDRYKHMQSRRLRKYDGGDLYIVIDEFADLMMTNGKQVRPVVQRLAQIGRAARVHIVLATQTPIAKVLPTEIKCNFDSRVGLRTRSAQDSRNILGFTGLEQLPRYGQAIYMKPEGDDLWNVPMVPDTEIDRLVGWWEAQARPQRLGLFCRVRH